MQTAEEKILVAKRAAAAAALRFIEPGMMLGLGTGSTASIFIELLGGSGLKVAAIASSQASEQLARACGIPLLAADAIAALDITVDGADEIDSNKQLIKGGGGALLKEKVLASMSKEMVVIADDSKLVSALGRHSLPVEIIPFAYKGIIAALEKCGYRGNLRWDKDKRYETEQGNYIIDLILPFPCDDPQEHDARIRSIPGVVETGFFLGIAHHIVIGYKDGSVRMVV